MSRQQGQPWGSIGKDRAASIQARVSVQECKQVSRIAKYLGLTVSAYVAEVLRDKISEDTHS